MNEPLLQIRDLVRDYGSTRALDEVTLDITEGTVVGLIGRNGAGKTTLIRHLLGLLRAQSGSVRVFGCDPARRPEQVLDKIGYVSEERDLPGWMTLHELLGYFSAFYPRWDEALATRLCTDFDLDLRQKVGTLSRGQHVRASLVVALAPRPPLLLLDEPSSGLDPVVRRDVLEAVLTNVANDGRTVVFSSHLLDEVERISSRLLMIDRGQIRLDENAIDALDRFVLLEVSTTGAGAPRLPEILRWLPLDGPSASPLEQVIFCELANAASVESLAPRLAEQSVTLHQQHQPSLDEVFVHLCEGTRVVADTAP
ncbi:MAG: ABC transporter ATP-binding protein [Acidobacteriota bacterium]